MKPLIVCLAIVTIMTSGLRSPLAYKLRLSSEGKPLVWNTKAVDIIVDTSDVVTQAPDAANAVQSGFVAWSSAGLPLQLKFQAAQSAVQAKNDGQNVVHWVTSGWKYGKEVVAMTVTMYKKSTGVVTDADVVFNAVDHQWTTTPETVRNRFDVQNVVTHEAGHFIGLGHDAEHIEAVMYAYTPVGETQKRILSTYDKEGIVAVSAEMIKVMPAAEISEELPADSTGNVPPATGGTPSPTAGGDESAAGGCSMAPTTTPNSLAVIVLMLAGILSVRRVRLTHLRTAVLVIVGSLTLAVATASATVLRFVSMADLSKQASIVVDAKVIEKRAIWLDGQIVTDYRLQVQKCMAGACQKEVVVRSLGGEIGDVGMYVEGSVKLEAGQSIVAFLRGAGGVATASRMEIVGWRQGVFHRQGQWVARDLRGLHLLKAEAVSMSSHITGTYQQLKLTDLEGQVRKFRTMAGLK